MSIKNKNKNFKIIIGENLIYHYVSLGEGLKIFGEREE